MTNAPTPGGRSFLTARQIFKATPPDIKERARYVRVFNVREAKDKANGNLPVYQASTQTTRLEDGRVKKGSIYTTTIKIADRQGHVIVECTCGFHPFYGAEYVLHSHGAAEIKHSNGQPPRIRNRLQRILACKHVIALTEALIRKGNL